MSISGFLVRFAVIAALVAGVVAIVLKVKADAEHIKLESTVVRAFELVAVDPPKHYYVDIKDVQTGKLYKSVYVSKRCISWQTSAVVGRTYDIAIDTYVDDRNGERTSEWRNIREVFCR